VSENPVKFGHFEILSKLGEGGMAEVFEARFTEGRLQGRRVALKRILPRFSRDADYIYLFAREAELYKQLSHPNIVQLLEVGLVDDLHYMAMDLVDGRDLGQILRRCKQKDIRLPADFAVYLVRTLLEALAYAHGAVGSNGKPLGIVHCDVSPSNLFISRLGDIKLGDFGVARARRGHTPSVNMMGKQHYLSPELLDGEATVDADLWAATVMLYELLTLSRPFSGGTPEELSQNIKKRRYRPLAELAPGLPPGLAAAIERGFAQDRAQRFRSASQYAKVLAPLYDERVGTPLAIAALVRGLFGAEG
jgi:serine/threonine-protein kinase